MYWYSNSVKLILITSLESNSSIKTDRESDSIRTDREFCKAVKRAKF